MSDAPAPAPASQPRPSVVIDTNSRVAMPKWHIYTAVGVVVALLLFTVVWFAANNDGDYTPGPWAQALLDSGAEQGAELDFPDAELECIDEAGARYGIDAEEFFSAGTSPLDSIDPFEESDPADAGFFGTMMDDCFSRGSRVQLFAQGILADSAAEGDEVTEEQAECVGRAFDDALVDSGGYRQLMEDPDNAMGVIFGMMGALGDCGIDMAGMDGL